jgi:hypothetical protein
MNQKLIFDSILYFVFVFLPRNSESSSIPKPRPESTKIGLQTYLKHVQTYPNIKLT